MSDIELPAATLEHLGSQPDVAADAFVAPGAVLVGDVRVASGASIWYGCVLRGDVRAIRVGERTNLQDGTIVHGTTLGHPVQIGADVTIGHAAVIHACTLEDRTFVGIGARVLDGAVMKSGSMLAAGAVLTPGKVVPAGQLWAGAPARPLRELTTDELLALDISAKRYMALARQYRLVPPAVLRRS